MSRRLFYRTIEGTLSPQQEELVRRLGTKNDLTSARAAYNDTDVPLLKEN